MAPPPPLAQPPRPPVAKVQPHPVARSLNARILFAPRVIPQKVINIDDIATAPDVAVAGSNGSANNLSSGVIDNLVGSVPIVTAPPPAAKPKPPSAPIRVGGGVSEANLIRKVQPIYPALAKAARIQGTVEFTATISKEGSIENLQLVRGHPLLLNAARDAVLQWKYRPTLLNGQPVEVITDIIVNFTLTQ